MRRGAGPGDPDLLTRRAAARLAEAELVLYDALVSPDLLPLAPRAQKLSVGKRACRPSISQETINRVLIRAAPRAERPVASAGTGATRRCEATDVTLAACPAYVVRIVATVLIPSALLARGAVWSGFVRPVARHAAR